ncbi:histidine phosphatase family protein [Nonomuraea sp. NPDC003727]
MPWQAARPMALVAPLRARHVDVPFPGGQSYRDVLAATADFLDDLLARRDGGRVLVIAHSANRWALECLLGGADLTALVEAAPRWQPGWEFILPSDWRGRPSPSSRTRPAGGG